MTEEIYISIPTWETGQWRDTIFKTRDDFRLFVLSCFKEPGQYEFDETAFEFNAQARKFRTDGYFCNAPYLSKDYKIYWDFEKRKNRVGAIFHNNGKTWYLTRAYYMWVNFLRINDKEQKKFDFPSIRDVQYHMALYDLLAELHYLHSAILKKRQIASSYFHCAVLINQIWFEETPVLKMGASLKNYINAEGSWKFLEEYREFLNEHTAWQRPFNPKGFPMWQQKIEEKIGNKTREVGLKGTLQGMSFEQSDTKGVGGPCSVFYYEEAGVAPTMDVTVEYLFPAMKSGMITTGLFIASGSVGDLDQCEPLKQMILFPEVNEIYPVNSNLIDVDGTIGTTGLFIPEQWSMPPYIDEFGNSLVEEAVIAIDELRAKWKKELSAEKYQLRISQHPKNIMEAFAYRKVSIFPQHLVTAQKRRIQEKEYAYEFVDIFRNSEGNPEFKGTSKLPITEFPITKKTEDKTGTIIIYERPDKGADWGTYYASIDPVSEGKTTTSESLCSIYIYKNPVEVTKVKADGTTENFIERDKIVASWCGRFDDITKTHERLELLIEIYNAWTVIENNISLFIQHMIHRKKQKYLVPKSQILFLKDLGSNNNVFQEYGWKNTGTLFKTHLLSYLIEFLKEELDVETKEDGTIVKTTYGIERIPDLMAMVEMEAYQDKINVDRLVALAALVAFARIQQANRGYRKRVDYADNKHLQKSPKMTKLSSSPFRHIGMGSARNDNKRPPRNPFRNLR
jgi:hypothetical protein